MLRVKGIVYFDRNIIRYNWKRINRGPLTRAGVMVMKIARRSIRRRSSRKPSPVGTAPYSHKPGVLPPFKQIFSWPDYEAGNALIGMVGYGRSGEPVPGLHEHGGMNTLKLRTRRGQAAYLQMIKQAAKKKSKGHQKTRRSPTKINAQPIMKKVMMSATYPKRAFMMPALRTAQPYLKQFWIKAFGQDTVRARLKRIY